MITKKSAIISDMVYVFILLWIDWFTVSRKSKHETYALFLIVPGITYFGSCSLK